MSYLSMSEMMQIPTGMLCQIYHHAQIACVHAATNLDFEAALSFMETVVTARFVVSNRARSTQDRGHVQFYNECVEQRNNLLEYLKTFGTPQQRLFRFTSGRLVGNAMDAGVYVPQVFQPEGWNYHRDYVNAY